MKLYEYVKVAEWIKPNDYISASVFMNLSDGINLDRRWLGNYLIRQNAPEFTSIELFRLTAPGKIVIILTREQFIDLLAKNVIVAQHME